MIVSDFRRRNKYIGAANSSPERGLGLFQDAAEPDRADASGEAGRRVGFDGDGAQRRRARCRLETRR
jgi:hypothetical protein